MPRSTDEPTERVHCHLYRADLEFIRSHFGGLGNIGQNAAIRGMVRRVVSGLRAKAGEHARAVAISEHDIANVEEPGKHD